jgi:hypothetical protein
VEVERRIEPFTAQLTSKREIPTEPRDPPSPGGDDDVIDSGIARNNGCGARFNDVCKFGGREPVPQGANRWCRKDDVTDFAQTDEKDPVRAGL